MMYLLASEWLKMRKRWMPRILILLLLALIALLFWGFGASQEQRVNALIPRAWIAALFLDAAIAPFLWPILAGSWAGGEYGWGTIRMILSRRPGRIQFAVAGLIIILLVVGIALLLSLVVASAAGAIVGTLTGHSIVDTHGLGFAFWGHAIEMFLAAWYALAFYVVLAYAAGTVFRSSAVGIGIGIGIIIAELILRGIFFGLGGPWRDISDHLPSSYTGGLPARVAHGVLEHNFSGVGSATPSIGASIIGIAVYIAIPLAITLVLIQRRDVTA